MNGGKSVYGIKVIMQKRNITSFLLASLMLLVTQLAAQRVLLSESVDTVNEVPMFGPNRSVFVYPLVKIGVFTPPYEKGGVVNFWSSTVSGELRTKAKICRWNALVLDVGYRCDRFILSQDDTSYLPTYSGKHKRERLSTHNITFSLCDRINFGRRGNIQGIYLDFGFYGDYVARAAHFYVEEFYDSNSAAAGHTKLKVKNTDLPFINRLNYGFTARFGWEWGSVFAMYRMTDLIMDPPLTEYTDMPNISAGVEMYFVSY
jgi:hypothetical protein